MDRNYGGVIWTNHALERMEQRHIKQGDAWATFNRPVSSKYDPNRGAWVYRRVYGNEEIEVVAKKSERGEWLVISVWSNIVKGGDEKTKNLTIAQKFIKWLFNK